VQRSLRGRVLGFIGVAALIAGCSDDDSLINGVGGTAGAAGAAGAAGSGGSSGAAGAAGAAGAGVSGSGGSAGSSVDAGADSGGESPYAASCQEYCGLAAAFHNGNAGDAGTGEDAGDAGSALDRCEIVDPECEANCVLSYEAFADSCKEEYDAMQACFITDNTWICGATEGGPTSPYPAGCFEELGVWGACASE
jgi:hypothetical protein